MTKTMTVMTELTTMTTMTGAAHRHVLRNLRQLWGESRDSGKRGEREMQRPVPMTKVKWYNPFFWFSVFIHFFLHGIHAPLSLHFKLRRSLDDVSLLSWATTLPFLCILNQSFHRMMSILCFIAFSSFCHDFQALLLLFSSFLDLFCVKCSPVSSLWRFFSSCFRQF